MPFSTSSKLSVARAIVAGARFLGRGPPGLETQNCRGCGLRTTKCWLLLLGALRSPNIEKLSFFDSWCQNEDLSSLFWGSPATEAQNGGSFWNPLAREVVCGVVLEWFGGSPQMVLARLYKWFWSGQGSGRRAVRWWNPLGT